MARFLRRSAVVSLLVTTSLAGVPGCSKSAAPPVEDAAPAAAPPPDAAPTVTELAPMGDDGGDDGAVEAAAPKRWGGNAAPYNANQARIKECCNAMRAQARQLGSSPESFQISSFAAQCDVFATQVGPQGTAPELAQLRQLLKTIKLPGACQF